MTSIAIIGAGLSGLTVATYLQNQARITLFDKSRGVSGRMSTRRAHGYAFDHGAQFFTVRHPAFQSFIDPMIDRGIIQPWYARFVEIDHLDIISRRQWHTDPPHYVGVPAMNAVAKYLSQGLDVMPKTRVISVMPDGDKWSLQGEHGYRLGNYDWVVSAVPPSQACELLPASLGFYPNIQAVTMQACFSLMLGFEKRLPLTFDAAHVRGNDLSWISVNSSKPGRDSKFCLLVHGTNQWSDDHIDDNRDEVKDYLCNMTSQVIGYDVSQASYKSVHGWRYANVSQQQGHKYFIDERDQIAVCGDWFIKGRVEAAFISGYNLASHMMKCLSENS